MSLFQNKLSLFASLLIVCLLSISVTQAANVTLTFSNISGANGPALSPFFAAFHDGTFDAFNPEALATSAIELVAETGNGAGLTSVFAASKASNNGGFSRTVTASINAFGPGIFLPGASGSITVDLDPVKNRYLSYFAMVVPSNDRFLGNDSPIEIELFDSLGNFTGGTFQDNGAAIWDAGTETDGLFGAAFLVGSSASDSPAQNGVIQANNDFSVYAGLATPAGYNFTNLPGANTPLLRITAVSAVPVPAAAWLFGSALPFLGFMRRRKQGGAF